MVHDAITALFERFRNLCIVHSVRTDGVPASGVQGESCHLRHEMVQSGEASWYAQKFQGRETANGERFNTGAFTAAHRTLPLGSYVRVRSVATGKSVVVRINDRGPYVKGRIIDLSYAAAKALGLTDARSMQVQIERVGNTPNAQTASDGDGILTTGR